MKGGASTRWRGVVEVEMEAVEVVAGEVKLVSRKYDVVVAPYGTDVNFPLFVCVLLSFVLPPTRGTESSVNVGDRRIEGFRFVISLGFKTS